MRPSHVNKISCHTCKFWECHDLYEYKMHQSGSGECRRNAPAQNKKDVRQREFPRTFDHDWCGEWKTRPKAIKNKTTQNPVAVAKGIAR